MNAKDSILHPGLLILQFVAGIVFPFWLFSALFTGMDAQIVFAISAGAIWTLIVSGIAGRQNVAGGILAALAFAGPLAAFSVFSGGDALLLGNWAPFCVWGSASLSAAAIGTLGVGFGMRSPDASISEPA